MSEDPLGARAAFGRRATNEDPQFYLDLLIGVTKICCNRMTAVGRPQVTRSFLKYPMCAIKAHIGGITYNATKTERGYLSNISGNNVWKLLRFTGGDLL